VLRERGVGVITANEARHAEYCGAPPDGPSRASAALAARASHRATCRSELHEAGTWPTLEAGAVSIAARPGVAQRILGELKNGMFILSGCASMYRMTIMSSADREDLWKLY